MNNRRIYDRHNGLVLDYLVGLLSFTGGFCEKNKLAIDEFKAFGGRPRQLVESADVESILFFADLLSRARHKKLKKNLLEHVMVGRLPLGRLKDLQERLYGPSDANGPKIIRGAIDRIVIFVWKVLGATNREISDRTGLNENTVRNHITHIYEVFIPGTDKLPSQKRHSLFVNAAVEEGFIYRLQGGVPAEGVR